MTYTATIQALRQQESTHWEIGDALVSDLNSNSQRDWDNLAQILEGEGLDYRVSTLKAYRRVAQAFPASDRRKGVSFAAHQAALTAGPMNLAKEAIDRAVETNGKATRDAVLNEVRQMKGRTANSTSDAVAAWRDLRRGVEKLLDLPETELEALLTIDNGTHAGQAPDLSRDLAKVSVRIAGAMKKAEATLAKAKAREAAKAAKASGKPRATKATKAKAPQAEQPKRKPQVGRLGKGRGEG